MADESTVVRIAREYREQLARNEDAIMRDMARHWARMERQLEAQYIALAQEIQELSDNGIAIPKGLIYQQRRYIEMMSQIDQHLAEFDTYTVQVITDYQRKDWNLGLDDANAQIKATSPDSAIWNQVAKDTAETMAGFAGNGAPLGDLLRRDYGDLGQRVTDALVSGIGLGKGALATARDIRNAVSMEYDRALRIARTETNRAYRLANAEQYRKSGVVEKVLRLCYPPTACFACLMMDGEECPNGICDDHPNGKCTTIAVTVGGHYPDWEHGQDWLLQQDEATQRAIMGDARYEMWKNDGIALRDMVTMKDNPVWGGSPSVVTVSELKQKYNIGSSSPISLPSVPQAQPAQRYTFGELMGDAYKGNKYTDAQRQEIEAKYEAMPDWLQGFYHKYGSELKPVQENNEGKVPRKNIDFGYFAPYEGKVHFLAKRDAQGRSDENPFELGMHEYGHNMDWLAGGKKNDGYLSSQYKDAQGRSFLEIINDGFDKSVRMFAGKADTEKVTDSDVADFTKMMKRTYSMKERGVLSDMMGNYSVKHGGSSYPLGIGHSKSYIKKKENAETEAFAGITQSILGNPEALEVIKQYNEDAYEAYKDMVTKAGQ